MPPPEPALRGIGSERPSPWRLLVVGLLVCGLLNACTTTRSLAMPGRTDLTQVVKPGDTVRCTLRDDTVVTFVARAVAADSLAGGTQRVEAKDLTRLEVKRFSAGKTAGLAAAFVLVGVASYGLSNLAIFPAVVP